jgi:hypothetical protein
MQIWGCIDFLPRLQHIFDSTVCACSPPWSWMRANWRASFSGQEGPSSRRSSDPATTPLCSTPFESSLAVSMPPSPRQAGTLPPRSLWCAALSKRRQSWTLACWTTESSSRCVAISLLRSMVSSVRSLLEADIAGHVTMIQRHEQKDVQVRSCHGIHRPAEFCADVTLHSRCVAHAWLQPAESILLVLS